MRWTGRCNTKSKILKISSLFRIKWGHFWNFHSVNVAAQTSGSDPASLRHSDPAATSATLNRATTTLFADGCRSVAIAATPAVNNYDCYQSKMLYTSCVPKDITLRLLPFIRRIFNYTNQLKRGIQCTNIIIASHS